MRKPKKSNGKRLYQCDECKAKRFVHWVELNRAAQPRCTACGSARLEMVSDEARDERCNCNEQRLIGDGGSLVLSHSIPSRKLVT